MVCDVDLAHQISVSGLTKRYPGDRGLLSANFNVDSGELVAVVGHNGAGKSTLLKMLAGWIIPDSGEALIDGISVVNRFAIVRKIGFVPEIPNLLDFFSVEYNLNLIARLFRIPYSRTEEILIKFGLIPFRKNKVRDLSKGLRQRVSIGRALLSDPPVLLFDEPTSGIDVEMTGEIHTLLKGFHAAGKTIIFTSHRPEEIQMLAARILVLEKGRLSSDKIT